MFFPRGGNFYFLVMHQRRDDFSFVAFKLARRPLGKPRKKERRVVLMRRDPPLARICEPECRKLKFFHKRHYALRGVGKRGVPNVVQKPGKAHNLFQKFFLFAAKRARKKRDFFVFKDLFRDGARDVECSHGMRKTVVRRRGINPGNESELADVAKPLDIRVVQNSPLSFTYENPFMNRIAYFNIRLHGVFILAQEGRFLKKQKTPRYAGRLDAEIFFLFFDSRVCFSAREIVFIHVREDEGRKERVGTLKEPIFFLFHVAVVRMPLRYCPKLDLPKALSQIFALDKADAIREWDRVLRKMWIARRDFEKNCFCFFKRSGKFREEPRFDNFRRRVKTVVACEKLVFLGEHAVPVKIAPRAYVHLDFKEGICVFKRARDPLPAFVPSFEIRAENSFARALGHPKNFFIYFFPRPVAIWRFIEHACDYFCFALGVSLNEPHRNFR